jgi:Spy/CpxP family protein refolding chaperone
MMDRMQMMSERLKLTDEQKEKLRPILQEEAQKMRELRDKEMTPDARRAAVQDLRQATQKRIKDSNILTPDQLTEWTKMQEQMRARGQERRAGGGDGQASKPQKAPKN